MIKDSGERTMFESGAVRDCGGDKGRFDLMPLNVMGMLTDSKFYSKMYWFTKTGGVMYLQEAFKAAVEDFNYKNVYYAFLETAKHFEQGATKYGENNWQKGIPLQSYVDSACRHYTKHMAGWTDEPHDRACFWNIMCAIWTAVEIKSLNTYNTQNVKELE